jgi:chromate reductase
MLIRLCQLSLLLALFSSAHTGEPGAADGHCALEPDSNGAGLCSSPPARTGDPPILVLVGSLRRLSTNAALAAAAVAAAPQQLQLALPLDSLPYFDADIEAAGLPAAVAELRAAAFGASGFLFATPEYNGATSGVLKNAIDWLSRAGPEGRSPLAKKPYAVVSAGGSSGGLRGQASVAAVVADSGMQRVVVEGPPVAVKIWGEGPPKFDADTGELTDAAVRAQIASLVQALQVAAREHASTEE